MEEFSSQRLHLNLSGLDRLTSSFKEINCGFSDNYLSIGDRNASEIHSENPRSSDGNHEENDQGNDLYLQVLVSVCK